jgi:hypothetical protein
MLLKCGTAGNAVPTLLRACPSGEIVPPVSCIPCGTAKAPAWIYVTLTVPGGYQELCLPDVNGNCPDRACVHIWSTGARIKVENTGRGADYDCLYLLNADNGLSQSIKRTNRTEANCDAYEDRMGDWYDPCDHMGVTPVNGNQISFGWDSDQNAWVFSLASPPGEGAGNTYKVTTIPPCTTGIYTFVVDYAVTFQVYGGDPPYGCKAGPIPVTVTIEFPEVG